MSKIFFCLASFNNKETMKMYYVYILASRKNGTIYIGVTNNLYRRMSEHKTGLIKGFTQKYKVNQLVYYEESKYINNAIEREKQLKGWLRKKKIALIESMNPEWEDLSKDWELMGENDKE